MQNETPQNDVQNEIVENSDEAAIIEPQTETATTMAPEITPEDAESLNAVQPSAGVKKDQNTDFENAVIELNHANFKIQTQTVVDAVSIDKLGVLDETELEYGASTLAVSAYPQVFMIEEIEAPLVKSAQTSPIAKDVRLPEGDITLSNATDNQKFINNTDHYNIAAEYIGKNQKLYGTEMDIQGVSDDTYIRYNFKTETSFRAVLKSDWNAVKNIEVTSEDLDMVTLKNFVHADVSLQGDADKIVRIIDAKRGVIETENGDDIIFVKALTNGSGWSNGFEIDSGAGNDKITVKGDDGHTISNIQAGDGNDIVRIRGEYEHADVNLDAGNDRFNGGNMEDFVRGGGGNDRIHGRAGDDVLYGDGVALAEASLMATELNFEFVKSQAGYKNTVGFYKVAEDGTIEDVQIVFENLKALSAGDAENYEIAGDASNVEVFIIANGYNKNGQYNDLDLSGDHMSFVYNHGQEDARAAQITDDAASISLVYNDGAGDIVLQGHIFHDLQNLNIDGQDHSAETINANSTEFGFEDLLNLGDRDYSDAVFTVEETPLYDFTYDVSAGGNDILRGGADHDLLIGGAGDDRIIGGADTDIAVFMGSADQYSITKSGNKYVIEDMVSGRDGTDILKGVEGLIFGIEDLYADIHSHWSADQIEDAFGKDDISALDLTDLVEGYGALQNAIDDFIAGTDQGQIETIAVDAQVAELMVFTTEDALLNSQSNIL